ncbi:preprotein translocase subunit SecG [Candidimonas nitroreducens]|uniref:Protein-export membrane protein SecG n=1 Tax=Candidimonas nitroreducens TaxID=683354 RepID=A0A225M6I5_9BURK|nr:preprotein translocase subunit SecG [Candidimonas nitroreducens]OWT56736.1 preprotein translocase subunit SecG [Candidimonas nitroreducens]
MQWLSPLLLTIQVVSSLAIIVLVLLQQGKGAEMGSAFGSGSAGSLFGASGAANFLSRTTKWAAIIFFASTGGLAYIAHHPSTSPLDAGVMKGFKQEAPAAPAPSATGSAVPSVPSSAPAPKAPATGEAAGGAAASAAVPSVPASPATAATPAAPASNGKPSSEAPSMAAPAAAPSADNKAANPPAGSDDKKAGSSSQAK